MNKNYAPQQDHIRVAAATPEVNISDVETNVSRIKQLYEQAVEQHVALTTFPEMSITGYTIGDLVMQTQLLEDAREGLVELADHTKDKNGAMIVGLPLQVRNGLYNTAALLADGEVKGIVPKLHLPTYREFYEKRWFSEGPEELEEIEVGGQTTTFGANQLFEVAGAVVGIEICEDLWVADQRNIPLVTNGAEIIANPSASPEIATKGAYRRDLVSLTAGRIAAGYVYSGADPSESTSDIVMSGHALVNELGRPLTERKPFDFKADRLTIADIDLGHIRYQRRLDSNFPQERNFATQTTEVTRTQDTLQKTIDPDVFIPKGTREEVAERLEEILTIQAAGLKKRLEHTGAERVILGLSGGLDSTLALLVALKTAQLMNKQPGDIIKTLTMPGMASSDRTQSNATRLADSLSIPNEEIPISFLAQHQLEAIGHDMQTQDVTYENTQARLRTSLLFNKGNKEKGIVLGTGDLSEIALGWSTYNGDHMSGYNVNGSVPKTLVRHLVAHGRDTLVDNQVAYEILSDILDTPISPELTNEAEGNISQQTEDIIGPYELHDFFLYYQNRWGDASAKVAYLAKAAFGEKYEAEEIEKWLGVFTTRYYGNQWKRNAMPDGPKVGTVSMSPRGDLRMPADATLPQSML